MPTRIALFALLLCSLFSMTSLAQTMDFEFIADDAECPIGGSGVTQNGIELFDDTPYDPMVDNEDSCAFGVNNAFVTPTNGTDIFGWCGSCNAPSVITLTVQRQDGAPFRLQSIDFSRFPGDDTGSVIIRGLPAGGGAPVTLEHSIDSDAWETVSFDNSFSNLGSVEIFNNVNPDVDHLLDNIVLTASSSADSTRPIPVMGPVAYLLLMAGVLFAAGRRFRHQ